MLILDVTLGDLDLNPSAEERSATFRRSKVEAFASNLLTFSCRHTQDRNEIWVGEEDDPSFSTADAIERYRSFDAFEGIKIIAEGGNQPTLELVRTAAGSSPLYIAAEQDRLVASWKFEDAVGLIAEPRPNPEACRIFLEHESCQVRDQVIQGIFMLWPGESATFNHDGLTFREADTPDIALPSTLTENARATDEFVERIAESLRTSLSKAANPLIELSGGLDSSCVAVAACTVRQDINSYGLVHEGAMGIQQRKRRSELVELLGLNDFEYPGYEHTPLAALGVDEFSFTPFDDNHRLSCAYAVDSHPVKDIDLVITGIGGDELTMEGTYRREEWEVPGNICPSALVASTARADMFMRRGIWPKNPLISQSVIDFCRALPKRMRGHRILNLLTLTRAGLSDGFLFPRYYEHYGNAMQREAALFDYDAALAQSIVADFGIIDISPLLERARQASYGGFSYKLIGELYHLLKLEAVLRRYVR